VLVVATIADRAAILVLSGAGALATDQETARFIEALLAGGGVVDLSATSSREKSFSLTGGGVAEITGTIPPPPVVLPAISRGLAGFRPARSERSDGY
jgi:hypothetical protein